MNSSAAANFRTFRDMAQGQTQLGLGLPPYRLAIRTLVLCRKLIPVLMVPLQRRAPGELVVLTELVHVVPEVLVAIVLERRGVVRRNYRSNPSAT